MDDSNGMQALRLENENLRRENEAYRAKILQYTMERAIGDDHLSQSLADHMEQFYSAPLGPDYCMILFHGVVHQAAAEPVMAPISAVSSAYRSVLSSFGQTFFFETVGTVCGLLNFSGPETEQERFAWIRRITETLCSAVEPLASVSGVHQISISPVSNLMRGPRMLYRDACWVYAMRTAASPRVCSAQDIPEEHSRVHDTRMTLEPLFWKQIQQQQFFDAASTLDQLIELSLLARVSLEQTLGAVFMRMEAILQIAVHTGVDPGSENGFTELLTELSQAKTYYEIRTCAYDILALLEDQFYTPTNNRNKKMPAIERFVEAHYSEASLGTAMISEEFKISPSYLARIFKSDKGISVTDYIHAVRIDAAKELLRITTLTLDEIAAKVGFSNRWVLIRVFKNMMGITPRQYKDALQ